MRTSSVRVAALAALVLPLRAAAQEVTIEALVQRCHAGEALACTTAGARYHLGRGVPESASLAVDLYTRGCESGGMLACGLLGALYADGRGVTRDEARAVTLFRRACDGGHEHSCGQLGLMMAAARGTPRDIPGAAPLLERGCNGNHHPACEVLGRMNVRGIGVPQNGPRGLALLQRACTGGQQSACGGDTGAGAFAPPPPVTGAQTYAAPPPVVGTPAFAPPPPVVGTPAFAPPPPVTAPRVVAPAPAPAPPPRVVYVERRVPVVAAPTAPSSSSSSSVSFLGGEHRASSFFLGGEFGVVRGDRVGRPTLLGLGFRHSRGPIEFTFTAQYGGGYVADVPRQPSWGAFVLGAGLGMNILSWPRSDRERFSLINLSGGINTSISLGEMSGGDMFRLGGYVANTFFFLCWLGVRTEFVGSLVGEGTWGHTLHASLFFGGRPSHQCR